VNELLVVLKSAISIEEVLELVIDTFWNTGVPTFTSPKSIADGLTMSAGVPVDEKGLEPAPQPESARLSAMAAIAIASGPLENRSHDFCLLDTSGRITVIFFAVAQNVILRNLYIGITCASGIWRSSRPSAESPASCNGNRCMAALVDYQQDRLWKGDGTGDDSHEGGMRPLPSYYLRNILHH
jgi:hypothetical protein